MASLDAIEAGLPCGQARCVGARLRAREGGALGARGACYSCGSTCDPGPAHGRRSLPVYQQKDCWRGRPQTPALGQPADLAALLQTAALPL